MRPKILFVHSTLHIGGAEEVTANLCRHIDKDRFDISVCFLKEKGMVGEKIETQGTEVFGIPRSKRFKTDYLTALRLRKAIRQRGVSLIHTHDVHGLADGTFCRLTTPRLRSVHTFHYGRYPLRDKPFRTIESACWRFVDKPVAVSHLQAENIAKLYRMPLRRLEVVWNGVDVSPNPDIPDFIADAKAKGKTVIGSINTLIEQKGMFDLLDTAALLKQQGRRDLIFLIAGDGPLRQPLNDRIAALGLQDEVRFLGWVDRAAHIMMGHIDIFFQPSLWEAMSIVLLEAMASGKPIVATDVGETPRIIESGRHGLLIKPHDIDAMARSLIRLVDDQQLRSSLAVAARQRYAEHFTVDAMAQRYMDLYERVLTKSAVRS